MRVLDRIMDIHPAILFALAVWAGLALAVFTR
jgi:hypothetical protein